MEYASGAATDRYGQSAFFDQDISRPNNAYFDRAERIVQLAADRGLVIGLSSAWSGFGGDGYYSKLTPNNARNYGRYLGRTSAGFRT